MHAARLPLLVATLLASPHLVACVEPVVLGGEGGGDGVGGAAGTTNVGSTSMATTAGATSTSVATASSGPSTAAATGTAGSGTPALNTTASTRWITPAVAEAMCASASPCEIPDASILLVLDSAGPVCELPIPRDFPSGTGFRVSLALPPEVQVEGTYILEDTPGIVVQRGEEHGGGSTNAATVGGGPIGIGTLEILSIDDLQITFRATGLTWDELDSDGEYVSAPCE